MVADSLLTVGYIPYLNCVPCFACLEDTGFKGRFVAGVPAVLNRLLQQDEIDVSPSSSFEYARNWRDYLILPENSISSQGPVKSVLLFSSVEIADLEGRDIAITGESATSINLLRVLLREFHGLHRVTDFVPEGPIEDLIDNKQPALLIGDRALRQSFNLPAGMKIFDLGELWSQHTGLPFVFALWMIRRRAVQRFSEQLRALGGQLEQARTQLLGHPEKFAVAAARKAGIDATAVIDYWKIIDYRLEQKHQESLRLFFSLCKKYELLDEEPELIFFS